MRVVQQNEAFFGPRTAEKGVRGMRAIALYIANYGNQLLYTLPFPFANVPFLP